MMSGWSGAPAPLPLALLGAGIFATDAYAPVLQEVRDALLPRYVWSRSQAAAEKLAHALRGWAPDVEAVWDEDGLLQIEADAGVPCCALVLPIQAQPAMVKRLVAAGKHVLQEKPIAASLQDGLETVTWYQAGARHFPGLGDILEGPRPVWGVGENFRFEPAFAHAASILQVMGPLLTVSVGIEVAMAPSNKYYTCEWRRDPSLPGGFIADCGVHYIAALRQMVRRRIHTVAAHSSHMSPGLPPPDTITATLLLEAGAGEGEGHGNKCSGTLQITFCAPSNKMSWRAVCEGGTVEVARGAHEGKFGYKVMSTKPGSQPVIKFFEFGGMAAELRGFAKLVSAARKPALAEDNREHLERVWAMLTPMQALEDTAVVSACLKSGAEGGIPKIVDLVSVDKGRRFGTPLSLSARAVQYSCIDSVWTGGKRSVD